MELRASVVQHGRPAVKLTNNVQCLRLKFFVQ